MVFVSREEENSYGAVGLSKDHRLPLHKNELLRVEEEGLELRTDENSNEWRLCAAEDPIGSATTRALGNLRPGMLSEAEVNSYKIRDGRDIMLLLGTRGLFANLSSSVVVSALFSYTEPFGEVALRNVCREARRKNEEVGGALPDVTGIAISLGR